MVGPGEVARLVWRHCCLSLHLSFQPPPLFSRHTHLLNMVLWVLYWESVEGAKVLPNCQAGGRNREEREVFKLCGKSL